MASPSQPQVLDEIWDDQRIQSFLKLQPFNEQAADFCVLIKAYQGMRAEDFHRFITFFIDAGRDINALDDGGRTVLDIISKHRHATEFVKVLEEHKSQHS